MKYSVVIAARNEEVHLPDALLSVSDCDDIVVVDDNSTDATRKIAEAYGARVFERVMNNNFATQKNFGIDQTKHNWVLLIDADERVSPELLKAMDELGEEDGAAAYEFAWKNFLGAKWLAHGGLYPDYHTRLFDKRRARYGAHEIHEQLEIKGESKRLDGDIIHLTYKNTRAYYSKVMKYARLEAAWTSERPSLKSALKEFLVRYVKQQGYKDGGAGLISAALLGYYRIVVRQNMGRS